MSGGEQKVDVTHREMYRAVVFMVEDATANPRSPPHKEATMWNDLSPLASECLWVRMSLSSLPEY